MSQVLVARCEQCSGGFELPLVFDPVTLRTEFDIRAMVSHQMAHQRINKSQQKPRSEG